jgi:hypothetical protein
VRICPRVISYLLTLTSLAIFRSLFSFPALCVCGHLLIATRRSTSSCYASPRVLRIGSGGAGNRRGPARCAGFCLHSSSRASGSLYISLASSSLFYIPSSAFMRDSISCPLLSFLSSFLHSSLLPQRPPSILFARIEACADPRFVAALRVPPVHHAVCARRAKETLDESAVSPHRAPRRVSDGGRRWARTTSATRRVIRTTTTALPTATTKELERGYQDLSRRSVQR